MAGSCMKELGKIEQNWWTGLFVPVAKFSGSADFADGSG